MRQTPSSLFSLLRLILTDALAKFMQRKLRLKCGGCCGCGCGAIILLIVIILILLTPLPEANWLNFGF